MTLTKEKQDGKEVIQAEVLGRTFTFINRCPHLGCDLSKGRVEESTIVCVCGWQYDLLTGRAVNHPLASLEKID